MRFMTETEEDGLAVRWGRGVDVESSDWRAWRGSEETMWVGVRVGPDVVVSCGSMLVSDLYIYRLNGRKNLQVVVLAQPKGGELRIQKNTNISLPPQIPLQRLSESPHPITKRINRNALHHLNRISQHIKTPIPLRQHFFRPHETPHNTPPAPLFGVPQRRERGSDTQLP